MKRTVAIFMSMLCISNVAFADCDYSKGVTPLTNGEFSYTKDCHIKNGVNLRDLRIADEQVKKLTEAASLLDLALAKANERSELWQSTSYGLEKRVETMDELYQRNKWLYFGLGVLTASAAVWGASRLRK